MLWHARWDATVEEVMANWPVTAAVVVAEKISYPARRVLHLRCDQGEFAAKINSEPGSVDTEQRLAVLDHVASRGFRHAPALLRTCAGTPALCTPSRTITLLEYIPAPVITGDADTLAGWRDLGAAAARLNVLGDYTVPFALPVHRGAAELAARATGSPFDAGVRSLLGQIETLADLEEVGLIHGEINGANAGRRTNGEAVLLDWDQAGVGPLALEYGYPLIAASSLKAWSWTTAAPVPSMPATKTPAGTSTMTACSTPPSSTPFGTCGSVMSIGAGSGSCTPSSTRIS